MYGFLFWVWLAVCADFVIQDTSASSASEHLSFERSNETSLEVLVIQLYKELFSTKGTLLELEMKLKAMQKPETSSTFIRWGRKTCPNQAEFVYEGLAGGKYYTDRGSGSNRICLTKDPEYDDLSLPQNSYEYGKVHGGEYGPIENHLNYNVPCCVCRAALPTTIMVPATRHCPTGWTTQYTGHLTAARHNHYASEYVCLDDQPEHAHDKWGNNDGLLFYYTVSECRNLPCPPFEEGRVVTCVVCSK